jgi:hypothetical protein
VNEQCGFIGFIRRVLYKLSGQKIISFLVSALMVFLIVWAKHRWSAQLTDAVALKAISSIETICIALLGVKGAQNIVGMIKGINTGGGNGG